MTKLNQLVAIVSGKKSRTQQAINEVYKTVQKEDLFNGQIRIYSPVDDEGETLPPESQKIRKTVSSAVTEFNAALGDLLDTILEQDVTNQVASADIVVDNVTIATKVPVTYLMFLEKQLTDLHTFASKLPTVSQDEEWLFDSVNGHWKTSPKESVKTKKVLKTLVMYEATDKHPAQVKEYTEDVKVGTWKTIRLSSALTQPQKSAILNRVDKLRDAVKVAREQANQQDVLPVSKISNSIFNYVFNSAEQGT